MKNAVLCWLSLLTSAWMKRHHRKQFSPFPANNSFHWCFTPSLSPSHLLISHRPVERTLRGVSDRAILDTLNLTGTSGFLCLLPAFSPARGDYTGSEWISSRSAKLTLKQHFSLNCLLQFVQLIGWFCLLVSFLVLFGVHWFDNYIRIRPYGFSYSISIMVSVWICCFIMGSKWFIPFACS